MTATVTVGPASRSAGLRHARRQIQRTGVRVIPVDHDAYDLAKATAKAEGIPMGEWTTRAINAYAALGEKNDGV